MFFHSDLLMIHSNYSGIDVGPGKEKNLIHTPKPNPPAPYWFVCIRFDANHTQQSRSRPNGEFLVQFSISRTQPMFRPVPFSSISSFTCATQSEWILLDDRTKRFQIRLEKIKWLSNKWLNLLYTWRNERNIYHTPQCCRREKKSPGTATT